MRSSKPTNRIDCLGLGIMTLDLIFSVDRYPKAGSKIDGGGLCIQGGGPVPNAMIGLQRLGHSTALITAVADDLIGRMGVEDLKAEKVDHRFVVVKRGRSDTAMGLVESISGRRTMVLSRSIGVRPRDLTLHRYSVPRIVHLDGRDLDTCIKLARWGRRMGAIITFDIGSLRNDVSPIFPLVNHLVVADSFALPFTGARSARQAVTRLQSLCHGTVVVTQGIRGAIGCEGGVFQKQAAFRVKNVDTTGAGDAFHAGYLYGLLHEASFKKRLEIGSAVSALSCTQMGARAGLPTLLAVRKFLKRKRSVYA